MENTEELRKYELMVILSPDLGEKETANKLKEIKEHLMAGQGEITHEDIWGLRDLAYRIKGKENGYYAVIEFTTVPHHIREVDNTLKLDHAVVRHMVITLPEKYESKTLKQYEEEGEKAEKEMKEAREKKAKPQIERREKKEELLSKVEEELKVPAAENPAEETAEKKTAKRTKKAAKPSEEKDQRKRLEEVEEKLKSIIENPDIEI